MLPNRKPAIIAVHETAALDEVTRHAFTAPRGGHGWRYCLPFDIQIVLPMRDSAARTFPRRSAVPLKVFHEYLAGAPTVTTLIRRHGERGRRWDACGQAGGPVHGAAPRVRGMRGIVTYPAFSILSRRHGILCTLTYTTSAPPPHLGSLPRRHLEGVTRTTEHLEGQHASRMLASCLPSAIAIFKASWT